MRFRPIASLSVAAAAVLLLAGCAGGSTPDATDTASAGTGLCAAAAPSGAASDGVTVDGDFGAEATASFSSPLEVPGVERTVVSEGDGAEIADGDYLSYALTAFDAASGEQLGSAGYADTPLQPQQITSDSVLAQLFGCSPVGSRVVATLPASDQGGAQIYVLDILDATPASQWCVAGDFTGEAPTVVLNDGALPTVTVPQTAPPETVSVEVLEKGDGAVVEPGAAVEVYYSGLKWSDGSAFDSAWAPEDPAPFTTDAVVPGFKAALEGQTVGSTVLVAMPASCGYGVAGTSSNALAGEALVFVLQIASAEPAAG